MRDEEADGPEDQESDPWLDDAAVLLQAEDAQVEEGDGDFDEAGGDEAGDDRGELVLYEGVSVRVLGSSCGGAGTYPPECQAHIGFALGVGGEAWCEWRSEHAVRNA